MPEMSQFDSAKAIAAQMKANLSKSHEAARIELEKGRLAQAYAIAESSSDTGAWRDYVMGGIAWLEGKWLRSIAHLTHGLMVPPRNPIDLRYLGLIEAMYREYGSQAPSISRKVPRPSLSAVMIVRDEGDSIEATLESIASVVDEIVIVDTGSSDDTLQKAARFSPKVGHFEWIDDFAAARNFALELATSDWILSIDADERLDPTSVEPVLAAIHDASCISMPRQVSPSGQSQFVSPRLFPRSGAKWIGALHEYVLMDDRSILAIPYAPFVLSHASEPSDSQKRARNRKIVDTMPEGEDRRLYSALESLASGSPGAVAELRAAFDKGLESPSPTLRKAAMLLTSVLANEGKIDEAAEVVDEAVAHKMDGLWTDHFRARRAWMAGEKELAWRLADAGLRRLDLEGPVEFMRQELRQIIMSG